jgi:DNA-directed RNA polymerase subunit RPC12/RpoP
MGEIYGNYYKCSNCKKEVQDDYEKCSLKYCPNCVNRYLIVEDEAPLTAMFSVPATYECFDCPKCGCQNRVNERKGGHIIDEQTEADTDEHL